MTCGGCFTRGADKVGVNTAAVNNPDVIDGGANAFGCQAIVVAIDAKRTAPGKWEVFTHGGRTPVGRDALEWAKEVCSRGGGEILLTSMDADGTKGRVRSGTDGGGERGGDDTGDRERWWRANFPTWWMC